MGSYSLYLSPFISDNLNMDEYADRVEEFYSSDLFRHRVYDVAYRIIDPPIGFDHEEGKKSLEIENAPGFSGDPDSDWSDYSDWCGTQLRSTATVFLTPFIELDACRVLINTPASVFC